MRPRRRARVATLLSTTTILGLLLSGVGVTGATAAEGQAVVAPPVAPFDPAVLDKAYPSNTIYDFVPMLDGFTSLKANRPDIMKLNDKKIVTINQAATRAQSDRAIIDQYGDMSITMSDGLGRDLGAIYRTAREAGQLPKTAALLAKSGGLVGRYSSTNPVKNFYDNPRPYVRFPLMLKYRDKVGGNAWAGKDGSYPSGHTSQAFWQGISLATMLPELAPQILARASDAGNNRIVMGAHYPLDVMAGRMMGQKIVEGRWSDAEFRTLFEQASVELHTVLEAKCGAALEVCIAKDKPYLPTAQALKVYQERLTYGFPLVGNRGEPVTVPTGAESLLMSSHPDLTPEQRRQVLALTAIGSGSPLDKGAAGSWQRLDLAAAMSAKVTVTADGTVSLVKTGGR
jgi:membrane-associated phospholipid phosphatase